MRVLISGIGRSATTLLYQQIAKCLLYKYKNIRFRYEPYIWALTEPVAKGNAFGMAQLSHYGIHVHKSTPLFLRGSSLIHDEFADSLFGRELQSDEESCPEAHLTKVIRGAGRLESYIKRFPDIKIIACLRNPVETINSSLGMFSFLGEEFHEPDNKKLIDELSLAGESVQENAILTPLEYSILWWRKLTDETLRVAEKYPKNVRLFFHERYTDDPETELESLSSYLPFVEREIFQVGSAHQAGPKIAHSSLLASDLDLLYPHLEFYLNEVLSNVLSSDKTLEFRENILNKVAGSEYSEPVAGDPLGRKTPIQLRDQILSQTAKPPVRYTSAATDSHDRIPLDHLVSDFCKERRLCSTREKKYCPAPDKQKTFGCLITCHNDEQTILDSLVSALNQTRPFDKIVVVDDASTDNSLKILKDFSTHYKSVEILELKYNVGVTAARHFGFLELDTDFVTQLDGDDCFWPSKNYHEAAIVLQDEDAIAFSDILMLRDQDRVLIPTLHYESDSRTVASKLLKREDGVPRDMTFARKLYLDINGYDLRVPLYEDLDFKMRLALHPDTKWRRSNAIAGTIYDRRIPSWSRDVGLRLNRASTSFFFRFVDKVGLSGPEAAEAYRDLHRNNLGDWGESLFERLFDSTEDGIQRIKSVILNRRTSALSDDMFTETIQQLCLSPSFDAIAAPWELRYGVSPSEGPYPGYDSEKLHWQTAKNCGFLINSKTNARGVRGLLYLPHLPEQKLDVTVEQAGKTVQQSFVLDGLKKDDGGNHSLQEVEIPIELKPGETKISCFASSCVNNIEDRALYCLFADWQLYC